MAPRSVVVPRRLGLLAVVAAASLACRGSPPPPDLAGPTSTSPAGGRPTATSPSPLPDDPPAGAPSEPAPTGPTVRVIRVVDGDTFHVLRQGRDVTIRLIGIDTPEVGWYGGEPDCYGAQAGRFVRRLVEGTRLALEFDADRIDPYGRTLAYAYLQDGRMLNALLVRRGLARVTIYPPNGRHEPQLRAAEEAARSAGRGLWSACRVT